MAENAEGRKKGKLVTMKLDYIYDCGVPRKSRKRRSAERAAGVVPLRLHCCHISFPQHII